MVRWHGIVMHMTQGPDSTVLEAEGIRAYHKAKGWQDIGYHFVVERVESSVWTVAGRPLNVQGAHCRGYNRTFLGVALAGDFRKKEPPADQLECAARFVAGLADALALPEQKLYRHCDLSDTDCPGAKFPWVRFRQMVKSYRSRVITP